MTITIEFDEKEYETIKTIFLKYEKNRINALLKSHLKTKKETDRRDPEKTQVKEFPGRIIKL